MKILDKTSSFRVSWFPVFFVLCTVVLAWIYLESVSGHRYATDADVALIRPVVYLLTGLAPFVILTCVERVPADQVDRKPLPTGSVVVIISIPLAIVGIFVLGFAPTSILGSFVLAYSLSGRRLVLSVIAGVVAGVIVIGLFRLLLDVRLPLWPGWI